MTVCLNTGCENSAKAKFCSNKCAIEARNRKDSNCIDCGAETSSLDPRCRSCKALSLRGLDADARSELVYVTSVSGTLSLEDRIQDLFRVVFHQLAACKSFIEKDSFERHRWNIAKLEKYFNDSIKSYVYYKVGDLWRLTLDWIEWVQENDPFPLATTYAIDTLELIQKMLTGRFPPGTVKGASILGLIGDQEEALKLHSLVETDLKKSITAYLRNVVCFAKMPPNTSIAHLSGNVLLQDIDVLVFAPTRCHLSRNVHERSLPYHLSGDIEATEFSFCAEVLGAGKGDDSYSLDTKLLLDVPINLVFESQIVNYQVPESEDKGTRFISPSWAMKKQS